MLKTHVSWAGRVNGEQLIFSDKYAINSNSILICVYIWCMRVTWNGYDIEISFILNEPFPVVQDLPTVYKNTRLIIQYHEKYNIIS